MKKIYIMIGWLATTGVAHAQTFFNQTTYKGAFPVTDGNTGITSNDWTAGWSNWDPQNTSYAATTITVSSDITSNTTWNTGSVVLLQNKVYVKNGATLTIQPGVIIRGDYNTQGTLIITKGAKIMAQGTQTSPIVFTSNNAPGNRAEGDWGGVVILGNGVINQPGGVANIEGITASADTEYGGSNDADNSGTLSYVRIEFPGIALQPNKEINGLTLGAVGSATQIDHIQISFSGDDGYEFFGGKVDAKYLISFRTLDDDFDTDYGYRGRIQFGLVVRDPDLSDAAGDSNGFESDGEGTAPYTSSPLTNPLLSNFTVIGPKRDGTGTLPVGEKFERGVYIRRNSGLSLFNSVVIGWEKGLHIKDAVTSDNFTNNDTAVFGNNIITTDISMINVIDIASGSTGSFYQTIYTNDSNDSTKTVSQVNFVNGFPSTLEGTPDFRLQNSSVAATGASFADNKFNGQLISSVEEENEFFINASLYPNPAYDNVTLSFVLQMESEVNIEMIDLSGKRIYNQSVNEARGIQNHLLPVNELPSGIYFVRLKTDAHSKIIKLVVSK
ncbi:MAG: T9SS type A sorting domain-containing protein [Bacteroidota bacterium]